MKKEISSALIFRDLKLELKVSDEELAARKAKWQPREPKVTTGYLKEICFYSLHQETEVAILTKFSK